MVIDEAHSINLINLERVSDFAIPRCLKSVKARLVEDGFKDKRVGTLAPIDAVSQITEVVLILIEPCDSLLVGHIRACLHEFRSESHILSDNLCVFKLVLRNCKGTWPMVFDSSRFFLQRKQSEQPIFELTS